MQWVPVDGADCDFADRVLVLPSCDVSRVDQLAVDCLCFNFGTLVGHLISRHIDFVASQDPYRPDAGALSTSIDVYSGELPAVGPAAILRVSAPLPASKRRILDYSKEIVTFSQSCQCKQILLVRSVAAVFCIEPQIKDWPNTMRAYGKVGGAVSLTPLEEYGEDDALLRATVLGDFLKCLQVLTVVPFAAVLLFVEDGETNEQAVVFARALSGKDDLNIPPAWIPSPSIT
jgi:hypothetical protein